MELAYKIGSALFLTLIIVGNMMERNNPRTEFSRYMWSAFPALMYAGMALLATIVAFSMVDASVLLGWSSPGAAEKAVPFLGIPMAVLSLAVLIMAARAIMQSRVQR